jgi:hypothetical protein
MSRPSPQMQNLAKRIIACESDGDPSAESQIPRAFYVFEKLRPQLVRLMGNGGFRALVSRALRLSRPEIPWLRSIQVNSEGALEGLEDINGKLSLDALFVGKVALLGQLLGLLDAFIGENLTSGLVMDIWPQAQMNDMNAVKGNKHEKAN